MRYDSIALSVSNKAKTHRTFKPIWFFCLHKLPTEKNQKSLNLSRRTKKENNEIIDLNQQIDFTEFDRL